MQLLRLPALVPYIHYSTILFHPLNLLRTSPSVLIVLVHTYVRIRILFLETYLSSSFSSALDLSHLHSFPSFITFFEISKKFPYCLVLCRTLRACIVHASVVFQDPVSVCFPKHLVFKLLAGFSDRVTLGLNGVHGLGSLAVGIKSCMKMPAM